MMLLENLLQIRNNFSCGVSPCYWHYLSDTNMHLPCVLVHLIQLLLLFNYKVPLLVIVCFIYFVKLDIFDTDMLDVSII